MDHPTPGAFNQAGFDGLGAGPALSHTSGTFSSNFSLTLSASDPGAQIRYTLDGTTPTTTSPLYTGPIAISNTTQVRTRAFVPDFLPSPIVGHTFFKLDPDVQTAAMRALEVLTNQKLGSDPDKWKAWWKEQGK